MCIAVPLDGERQIERHKATPYEGSREKGLKRVGTVGTVVGTVGFCVGTVGTVKELESSK